MSEPINIQIPKLIPEKRPIKTPCRFDKSEIICRLTENKLLVLTINITLTFTKGHKIESK